MEANIITIGRVVLAFIAIALFSINFYCAVTAVVLTIVVIYLDSLDGYVARKLGVASDFGALLDITGDRIVENIYWIYFAAVGMISFWVPVIVITRSFLVDTVRSVAFAEGKTPFGKKTMMKSALSKALTSSPASRTTYSVSKALVFCYLGVLLAIKQGMNGNMFSPSEYLLSLLTTTGSMLVYLVVFLCVVRGIPVLWDGKDYVLAKRFPKTIKND